MTPLGGSAAAGRPGRDPAATRHRVELAGPVNHSRADALLAAAGRGDQTAFAAFYDETAAAVFGTLCRVPGRALEVERATVEVYRLLWQTAPDFDPAVRSAHSTLLALTRRALAGLVHELVAAKA